MFIQIKGDPKINYDELATLKQLAKDGALQRKTKISNSTLAQELDISVQTASRRLQALQEIEYIARQPTSSGQYVFVTDGGEEILQKEYDEYRRILEENRGIELTGILVNGMGEGRHFMELSGYKEQFDERLGYEPFAGTLNLELEPESVRTRTHLDSMDAIRIDGWSDGDQRYGPVYCYPGTLESDERTAEPIHVIRPERTRHDEDQLEIIAPENLRHSLDLGDGDRVTAYVCRD